MHTRHFWRAYIAIVALTAGMVVLAGIIPAEKGAFSFQPSHLVLQHPFTRMLEFATGVAAGRPG